VSYREIISNNGESSEECKTDPFTNRERGAGWSLFHDMNWTREQNEGWKLSVRRTDRSWKFEKIGKNENYAYQWRIKRKEAAQLSIGVWILWSELLVASSRDFFRGLSLTRRSLEKREGKCWAVIEVEGWGMELTRSCRGKNDVVDPRIAVKWTTTRILDSWHVSWSKWLRME
jgi:hypothetical protein